MGFIRCQLLGPDLTLNGHWPTLHAAAAKQPLTPSRLVIERARELRLPAVYQWPDLAEQGGLIGYGPRLTELFRLLGRQLVKILRGTSPGDIPIEQPSKFELVVNLKAAKEIGIEIPADFALRADKVIE